MAFADAGTPASAAFSFQNELFEMEKADFGKNNAGGENGPIVARLDMLSILILSTMNSYVVGLKLIYLIMYSWNSMMRVFNW